MNFRRITTILSKDLTDGMRDGRIIVLLLMPIVIAIFYNATAPERGERPDSTVVVVDPADTGVRAALTQATKQTVKLEARTAGSRAEAQRLVRTDDADIAVIAGENRGLPLTVLIPTDASATTQTVAGATEDVAATLTGRTPASEVRTEAVAIDRTKVAAIGVVEPRVVIIIFAIVFLAGMVAFMVVPTQTGEELETGSFGALRLAATGPEILTAKAAGGVIYGVAGTALIAVITQLSLADVPLFVAGTLLLSVSLVGFGVLLGLVFRNVQTINTWSIFILFPIVGLGVAVLLTTNETLLRVLDFLPFSQATKLLLNGAAPEAPFDIGVLTWAVLAAWIVIGFGLMGRYASRREV